MAGRRATQEEIDTLLTRIHDQFRGVNRGVSWHEALAIDNYGGSAERKRARDKDKDRNWIEVANDPNWDPDTPAHWVFLDGHGFRYYMAAAMTRLLRDQTECCSWFQMELGKDRQSERWSEFTREQLQVVAQFVLTMSRMSADPGYRADWRKIYEESWQRVRA